MKGLARDRLAGSVTALSRLTIAISALESMGATRAST